MSDPFAVQTRALCKSYPAADHPVTVLHGIDLDIRRGEFVSIMGPSGSGKTTLLNLIGLLDVPTSGRMRVAGHDVEALGSRQRARARRDSLGFVFQSFHLLPRLDALRNVMLPGAIAGVPRRERRERAAALLERVGLGDRMRHRPGELSGGQKQRVAIARALMLDPPLLLADEPTGNLDSRSSAEIMALFQQINAEGRTVIQVTHSEEMARRGHRVIRVRDGVVVRDPRRHFAHEAGARLPGPAAGRYRAPPYQAAGPASPARRGLPPRPRPTPPDAHRPASGGRP